MCQKDERGALQPINFVSRTTKQAEKNYGITELESLSVKYCFTKLAPYLTGLPVVVETDHSALVSMFTKTKECGKSRIDKWAMHLMSRFDFRVAYKPGKGNVAADALSRSVAVQGIVVVAVTTRRMARECARKAAQCDTARDLSPIKEAPATQYESETSEQVHPFEDSSLVEPRGTSTWDECLTCASFWTSITFFASANCQNAPKPCMR